MKKKVVLILVSMLMLASYVTTSAQTGTTYPKPPDSAEEATPPDPFSTQVPNQPPAPTATVSPQDANLISIIDQRMIDNHVYWDAALERLRQAYGSIDAGAGRSYWTADQTITDSNCPNLVGMQVQNYSVCSQDPYRNSSGQSLGNGSFYISLDFMREKYLLGGQAAIETEVDWMYAFLMTQRISTVTSKPLPMGQQQQINLQACFARQAKGGIESGNAFIDDDVSNCITWNWPGFQS